MLCTHQHITNAQLKSFIDKIFNWDMLIFMGDINAKVGSDKTGRKRKMGRHGFGEMNENRKMLADFCSTNSLVSEDTILPHQQCHKATWVSFGKQTEN